MNSDGIVPYFDILEELPENWWCRSGGVSTSVTMFKQEVEEFLGLKLGPSKNTPPPPNCNPEGLFTL